jgi:hypothetical protein
MLEYACGLNLWSALSTVSWSYLRFLLALMYKGQVVVDDSGNGDLHGLGRWK